jgi:hypothetical protein
MTMGLVVYEVDPSPTENVTSAARVVRFKSRVGMTSSCPINHRMG